MCECVCVCVFFFFFFVFLGDLKAMRRGPLFCLRMFLKVVSCCEICKMLKRKDIFRVWGSKSHRHRRGPCCCGRPGRPGRPGQAGWQGQSAGSSDGAAIGRVAGVAGEGWMGWPGFLQTLGDFG